MPLPRKTRGRQRVEMKRMDKKSNRQVTFSKRRAGLFKKASELCTLCGAKVAVIVFSPGKKVFSFGHPSVEYVVERFLGGGGPQQDSSGMVRLLEAHRDHSIQELNDKVTHASLRVEMVKRRGEELERQRRANEAECWWESPVEELSGSQLGELTAALRHLRDRLRHNIALAITKEDMIKRNHSALVNLHRPTYNNLNFGPYGGGGILVPIAPYNVAPPVTMPVVTNGGGFVTVTPGSNDHYYNLGQVLEYEDGHVVGGFRNLLLDNHDYGPPEFPGQGKNFAGPPHYVYQNPFGYGFF